MDLARLGQRLELRAVVLRLGEDGVVALHLDGFDEGAQADLGRRVGDGSASGGEVDGDGLHAGELAEGVFEIGGLDGVAEAEQLQLDDACARDGGRLDGAPELVGEHLGVEAAVFDGFEDLRRGECGGAVEDDGAFGEQADVELHQAFEIFEAALDGRCASATGHALNRNGGRRKLGLGFPCLLELCRTRSFRFDDFRH